MADVSHWWLVRCEGGSLFEEFMERGIIALGGEPSQPDLSRATDRDTLYQLLEHSGLWSNPRKLGYAWGVLSRFVVAMQPGDRVVTYDPSTRNYRIGTIKGSYYHATNVLPSKQHFRDVEWQSEVSRDDLPTSARNSLSSMISVFELQPEVIDAFRAAVAGAGGESPPAPITSPTAAVADAEQDDTDIAAQSREKVKDLVANLDWEDMEELVAGVLRAMGYKTRMTERGGDRGRDILASPDGLGFEHPRIVVEVKHRRDAVNSQQMRSFIGGLSNSDRGLFVSTGGFTKEARYEADRASVPVTILDSDSFVQLMLEHYINSDGRVRSLVPLVPIWWPAN